MVNTEDKIRWMKIYAATTEGTSNRRIKISNTILQCHTLLITLLTVIATLSIHFQWNKYITLFIILLITFMMLFLAFLLHHNAQLSSEINTEKFNILIREEKKLFGTSLFEEEYQHLVKKKGKRLSLIDKRLGWIIASISILFCIIMIVWLFV